jgi:arsenite methyltransferase
LPTPSASPRPRGGARTRLRAGRVAALLLLAAGVAAAGGCGAIKRFGYEGIGRDEWQKPDEVLALLDVAAGDRVADLGAGGGYFTFRLADAVGPKGRVYAVDVDDDMLALLRQRVADEGRSNVVVVRAKPDDPELPDGEIDLVFTCNTYHHLRNRVAYFTRLQADLAPGGRVAIVELDGSSWFSSAFGHNTPKQTIVDEMGRAGFGLTHDFDVLERQSFLVFTPASG